MQKFIQLRYLLFLVVLALIVIPVQSVFAHGSEPRIEISPERLNPGSVLDIRGVDFELDEEINLTLLGSQVELPLGTAVADEEGVFLLSVTLPVDLFEGTYVVHAVTDDHALDSSPVTVWGMPINNDSSQGQRTDEDSLLAPMPAFSRVATSEFAPAATKAVPDQPAQAASRSVPLLPVFAIIIVTILFGFILWMIRVRSS